MKGKNCLYCLLLIGLAGLAPANAQEMFTATWDGLPLFIPDDDANVTVAGLLFVPQGFQILDVSVQISIQHPTAQPFSKKTGKL